VDRVCAALALGASVSALAAPLPDLHKQVVIDAPRVEVWRAWTTPEGLAHLAGAVRIQLVPGGPFEWFLDGPPDAYGRRGSQGSRVVAVEAPERIVFDWTFPPSVAELREADARTTVTVHLVDLGEATLVDLTVTGWQEGDAWERGWRYFDTAWQYVLDEIEHYLEAPVG
jgi:uncharacterized protein YndB with AHSA1/START domain